MEPAGTHNILFNALKHHISAIVRLIDAVPCTELPQRLKALGSSQMDLYLGLLEEEDLRLEVIQALKSLNIDKESTYRRWLEQHQHYYNITLSDNSVWILRLGQSPPAYIHLHPGRHSPATIRVKATVLKTAIALWVYHKNGLIDIINDSALNRVRKEMGLPPVKALQDSQAILKMIGILENHFHKN
jgi:hypothetical protein